MDSVLEMVEEIFFLSLTSLLFLVQLQQEADCKTAVPLTS
jgi:hypothetical protein